jgi:hypothetical protein
MQLGHPVRSGLVLSDVKQLGLSEWGGFEDGILFKVRQRYRGKEVLHQLRRAIS